MSSSRSNASDGSRAPESSESAQYDVQTDYMSDFNLQHLIPRSPGFPEPGTSSTSSNDDRSSTSSVYYGNTRNGTYHNRTWRRLPYSSNFAHSERVRKPLYAYRVFPEMSYQRVNEDSTGARHSMGSTSTTEINEYDRRRMLNCLDASLRREIFDDSPDENPNSQRNESENTPDVQQTSDSSLGVELSTNSTSSNTQYMEELRSRPTREEAQLNAHSIAASAGPSGILPPRTGITISVNYRPTSLRFQSNANEARLDSNKKGDIMRKISDLQSQVRTSDRELAQMQELLDDLYRTVDAMQIHI